MTDSVTLTEAADRLGVHYMTAYRYVRTGRLMAEKRKGQWVVEVAELRRFVEPGPKDRSRARVLPSQLEARLLAGDENGALQIAESAMASGAGIEEVYLEVISPAMVNIGQRWARGEITIADEHIATATAMRVIGRIGPKSARRGRSRGVIVVAGVANDHHTLPTAMLRDLLRGRGFDVQDLGANTPAESILERAAGITDLVAVGLAATQTDNAESIRTTVASLSAGLDVPLVVGGAAIPALGPDLSLSSCLVSSSAQHALQLFEDIASGESE